LDPPNTDAKSSEADPLTKGGQRNFAFGAQLGAYVPSGLSLQLGSPDVALGLSGGFMPIIFNEKPNSIGFLVSGEAEGALLIRLANVAGTTPMGLRLGYRYNTVLGHGIGLGGYAERRLTKVVALVGSYGLTIYPNAFDGIRDEGHDPFGAAGVIGGGLSVGLLFYP
jgi:hypothetical protein